MKLTIRELNWAINDLKLNKSPGPDGIPNEFLQHLSDNMKNHILDIYNYIWRKHVYPKEWEEVLTIPIHKSNSPKADPNNYRLISMANTLSKLLQKIINKRLIWFLETNNILCREQSGFRDYIVK